jgi:uncharacterized membrane protein YdjX (TVP38/TMEM64 family)
MVPVDGLALGASLFAPRHWLRYAICTAIGSTLGAVLFAAVVQSHGTAFLEWLLPGIQGSGAWLRADRWADSYGHWALFLSALLPAPQQPMVAIDALTGTSLSRIGWVFLAGRALKYVILGWLASHAPDKLLRLRSVRWALTRAGEKVDPPPGGPSAP